MNKPKMLQRLSKVANESTLDNIPFHRKYNVDIAKKEDEIQEINRPLTNGRAKN